MKKIILGTSILVSLLNISLFAGADAGIEQEVQSGVQVSLDGLNSTLERDGQLIGFNWEQIDGSPIVGLSDPKSVTPSFIAPDVTDVAALTFKLTTKESYNCKKRKCRIYKSNDFVDIIVLPKSEVVLPEPNTPTEGGSEFMTHNGFKYLPIVSPTTGRIWLDRNLGSNSVCDNAKDSACFGDYYQWGRGTDGHQLKTSQEESYITLTLSTTSDKFFVPVEDGSYYYTSEWVTGDSDGSIRSVNWSKVDGSSVCPVGYRVPNITELSDELLGVESVFNSFLKLSFSGHRSSFGDIVDSINSNSEVFKLWSSEPSGVFAESDLSKAFVSQFGEVKAGRTEGLSVRCIKDQ